jgi:hypothetical protein
MIALYNMKDDIQKTQPLLDAQDDYYNLSRSTRFILILLIAFVYVLVAPVMLPRTYIQLAILNWQTRQALKRLLKACDTETLIDLHLMATRDDLFVEEEEP